MEINIGRFIYCVVAILVGLVIATHPVHCPVIGVIVTGVLCSIHFTR